MSILKNKKADVISKVIFGLLMIGVFAFVFGPAAFAQFNLISGSGYGYGFGYGYGYGYGYGSDGGFQTYRITGAASDTYGYGFGFGIFNPPASGSAPITFTTSTSGSNIVATVPSATALTGTSGGVAVTADIATGTTVTGNASWDGTINPPVATTATVSVSGFNTTVTSAITLGSSESDLTFSMPVQLTFAGQAGTLVGWYNHAGTFTQITDKCDTNTVGTTINGGTAFPAGGSCYINVGSDLIVWTEHFSTFATYNKAVNFSGSTGNGSGGGGGSGSYTNPYTILVNGGATQTNSANVTLTLTALAGMNQMWIANDPSFTAGTGTGWIPFQTTYPWTLTPGLGNKTVYVEFGSTGSTVSSGSAQAGIAVLPAGTPIAANNGTSMTQLQLLESLIAQFQALLQQMQAQGIAVPASAEQFLASAEQLLSGAPGAAFTRDLQLGSQGEDVRQLQVYLNAHGFPVAASGAGSSGNETTYFGPATQAALVAFQKSSGISPTQGYFGPKTRAYVSSH